MTSSTAAAPGTGLPPAWWAPGLTLRERLTAPDGPPALAGNAPAPDAPGFAVRLAALGVAPRQVAALAAEPPARLAARADRPAWAAFAERALAATGEPDDGTGAGGTGDGAAPDAHGGPEHGAFARHAGAPGAHGGPEPDGGPEHGAFAQQAAPPDPHKGPGPAEDPEPDAAPGPHEDPGPAADPAPHEALDRAGAELFAPVLAPLVAAAVRELRASGPAGAELDVLAGRLAEQLSGRLARVAAPALAAELAAARAAGTLTGDGPADRFAGFVARTGGRAGLARLFARYPVLARLLAQACLDGVRAAADLLDRYGRDRPAIVARLLGGADPGPLVRVDLGHGDAHQGGRSVAVLEFTDGSRVVHKPRHTGQHHVLDGLRDWLARRAPGLAPRTPGTVHGDGYGWSEFVGHRPCGSVADVDRFYRRQGALLALAHTARATDLHYDNLVADADQPVLVDVETLLHPTLPEATAAPDPASTALGASVHRTCLLPQLMIGDAGAADISGIGGTGEGRRVGTGTVWADAGTDTMRPVRAATAFPGGRNRPRLAGRNAEPADYRAALLDGFRTGYETITAHREELLAATGPLAAAADVPGRLILRPTQQYTALLEESADPRLLRDGLLRDAFLAGLCDDAQDDPVRLRLVEDEIADLWRGDVPVFFHRPAGRDVWTSRGDRIPGVLAEPGLTAAREALRAMGELDRHDQEWIITASLATTRPAAGPVHLLPSAPAPATAAAEPDPRTLLAAACRIADEIVARSVGGDGRTNWIGLELVADTWWTVLPMGAGLAHGYLGVALFLGQLGRLTGHERYTAPARRALVPVRSLVAALAADPELSRAVGPGAFEGLGGICYAVARLTTLLPDGIGDCLPAALDALAVAADDGPDTPLDLSAGLAGALAAAHAVARERGSAQAARLAGRVAGRLLDRAPGHDAGHGFAYGAAGVGWALLRHAADTGPDGPGAAAGRRLLAGALADPGTARGAGWCSGLAGPVLGAADVLDLPPAGPAAPGVLDGPGRLLAGLPPTADLSLCHGYLGTLEALAALAGRGHEGARDALAHRTGQALALLRHRGARCGTPDHVPSPGLLSGLAGIGYALLRLGFADRVPSVLLLQPGT